MYGLNTVRQRLTKLVFADKIFTIVNVLFALLLQSRNYYTKVLQPIFNPRGGMYSRNNFVFCNHLSYQLHVRLL